MRLLRDRLEHEGKQQRDVGSALCGTLNVQTIAVAIVIAQPVVDVHKPKAVACGRVQYVTDGFVIQLFADIPQSLRRYASAVVNHAEPAVSAFRAGTGDGEITLLHQRFKTVINGIFDNRLQYHARDGHP